MDDTQPPTDQLPLAALLDMLDVKTVNLGDWMNWPVSKKIGGQEAVVPKEVIGAHGGFPLSEWQKYLESPDNKLLFKGRLHPQGALPDGRREKESVKKGPLAPF